MKKGKKQARNLKKHPSKSTIARPRNLIILVISLAIVAGLYLFSLSSQTATINLVGSKGGGTTKNEASLRKSTTNTERAVPAPQPPQTTVNTKKNTDKDANRDDQESNEQSSGACVGPSCTTNPAVAVPPAPPSQQDNPSYTTPNITDVDPKERGDRGLFEGSNLGGGGSGTDKDGNTIKIQMGSSTNSAGEKTVVQTTTKTTLDGNRTITMTTSHYDNSGKKVNENTTTAESVRQDDGSYSTSIKSNKSDSDNLVFSNKNNDRSDTELHQPPTTPVIPVVPTTPTVTCPPNTHPVNTSANGVVCADPNTEKCLGQDGKSYGQRLNGKCYWIGESTSGGYEVCDWTVGARINEATGQPITYPFQSTNCPTKTNPNPTLIPRDKTSCGRVGWWSDSENKCVLVGETVTGSQPNDHVVCKGGSAGEGYKLQYPYLSPIGECPDTIAQPTQPTITPDIDEPEFSQGDTTPTTPENKDIVVDPKDRGGNVTDRISSQANGTSPSNYQDDPEACGWGDPCSDPSYSCKNTLFGFGGTCLPDRISSQTNGTGPGNNVPDNTIKNQTNNGVPVVEPQDRLNSQTNGTGPGNDQIESCGWWDPCSEGFKCEGSSLFKSGTCRSNDRISSQTNGTGPGNNIPDNTIKTQTNNTVPVVEPQDRLNSQTNGTGPGNDQIESCGWFAGCSNPNDTCYGGKPFGGGTCQPPDVIQSLEKSPTYNAPDSSETDPKDRGTSCGWYHGSCDPGYDCVGDDLPWNTGTCQIQQKPNDSLSNPEPCSFSLTDVKTYGCYLNGLYNYLTTPKEDTDSLNTIPTDDQP